MFSCSCAGLQTFCRAAVLPGLYTAKLSKLLQGRLCALDVGPDSVLHHDLIMDGLQDVRTVLESDFGQGIIDVNYFASIPGSPQHRLFLC